MGISQVAPGLESDTAVHDLGQLGDAPPRELSDIWRYLHRALLAQRELNDHEAAVRTQQHAIVCASCLVLPSPLSERDTVCDSSYFFDHRFFYQFAGDEEFFWITTALERAYMPATIYFPRRQVAVSLYPSIIPAAALAEFERFRAGIVKPAAGTPVVVFGFPHPIHMFWNELSAIERAAQANLQSCARLAPLFEPFGPTLRLFPEFGTPKFVRSEKVHDLNRDHRLLVGLGAWTIPEAVQRRVRRLAREYASPGVVTRMQRFRRSAAPVFWLSVKTDKRTFLDQATVLATLIGGIRQEYPRAGFILNGVSFPWDMRTNPNYVADFGHNLEAITQATAGVIDDLLSRLNPDTRRAVRPVSGVPVFDEIVWGEAADFYVCHGGSMAPKIGWIHRVPGLVHSNSAMRDRLATLPPQVEDGPHCILLPEELTRDCPDERFQAGDIDVDYLFTDPEQVLQAILNAFRSAVERDCTRSDAEPPETSRGPRRSVRRST